MKQIKFLTLLVVLLMTAIINLSAQWGSEGNQVTDDSEERLNVIPFEFNLSGTNVINPDFKSNGLSVDLKYGVINNISLNFTESWQDALLSIAPTIAYRNNSGILNNQEYAEKFQRIAGGLSLLVFFPDNYIETNVEVGNHSSDYTLKSGYTEHNNRLYVSAKFGYHQYRGRLENETFITTWNAVVSLGFPWNDQSNFNWSYEEMQPRQNETGQNFNAIHALIECGLIDLALSESFKICLKARGIGGKYSDIVYFGAGTGLEFVFNNVSALSFNVDEIAGWSNSKFDNLQFNLRFDYGMLKNVWSRNTNY